MIALTLMNPQTRVLRAILWAGLAAAVLGIGCGVIAVTTTAGDADAMPNR